MPSKNPLMRLTHIMTEIAFLTEALENTGAAEFAGDGVLLRAAERSLLIISEAAKSLPADLLKRYREVEWRRIADLGNVLRHEYNRVDAQTIWMIITDQIPLLEPVVARMILEQSP